ncbi:MAG: HNH endonuclease signature motif containing protein [Thermoleophilia bacterium]
MTRLPFDLPDDQDELARRLGSLGLDADFLTGQFLRHLTACIDASAGPDACWPWRGARQGSGYGLVSFRDSSRGAHRVVYALAVAPIPEGLQVHHSCDHTWCVNPAHLSAGTASKNMRDAAARGRLRGRVLQDDEVDAVARIAARQFAAAKRRGIPRTRSQVFNHLANLFDISADHVGTLHDRARRKETA